MRKLPVLSLAVIVVMLAACGGGGTMSMVQPNSAPMTLMIKDTPPVGVTVLRFEITVTGATLQPSDMNMMALSLINSPVKVELEKLETEIAFLSTAGAPAGTYSSIIVTFANPEMTILNQSGQSLTVGGTTCANGAVCKLEPPLSPAMLTVSTSPFPLMLTANSPMGLLLDFDVNASLQNNLSVSPSISFTQTTAREQEGELEDVDDVVGSVTAVGNNQFTLMDNSTGMLLTINVNGNTEFEFEESCAASNFSCVMSGQVLKVDLNVMPDGTLVARKVELEAEQNEEEVEGTVVSVNAASNQFQFVALDDEPNVANVTLGAAITVLVEQGATFEVDSDGLNLPNGLSFASIQDVLVGQEIQIRPKSVAVGTPVTITTDRVRLRTSQITGTVASVSAPNFTINNLPGLFTMAGITQIQVDTSSDTNFDGLNGVTNLTAGNIASVRGLLFGSGGAPVLVARKVRERVAD